MGKKETIGAPENEKERAPIVPNEGTLKEFGTKLLTLFWNRKLDCEYYIYQGKLYVVFSKRWTGILSKLVREATLEELTMVINMVKYSDTGKIKAKGGWEA